MKISTWNIERLKIKKNLIEIQNEIARISADIIILTEFNNLVELPFYTYKFETEKLPNNLYNYKETERRTAIFSKFPITKNYKTYDNQTSCCVEIETENGNLIVYGTIIGIVGIADKNFHSDLESQIADINSISKLGNFCFAGDLNTSFSDNYYFSEIARQKLQYCFMENNLINTTRNIKENIDHLVISENFIENKKIEICEWNLEKKISDHKGICIEF